MPRGRQLSCRRPQGLVKVGMSYSWTSEVQVWTKRDLQWCWGLDRFGEWAEADIVRDPVSAATRSWETTSGELPWILLRAPGPVASDIRVWAFRLFQRSKMSSVSSSQLCWACHRGSTKKQMLVYSLLYRPSTGDGGRLQHFLSQGYITHKSWRPLITLMYAAEWLLCARYGFQGMEMQPMRFISCVVHLFWICK